MRLIIALIAVLCLISQSDARHITRGSAVVVPGAGVQHHHHNNVNFAFGLGGGGYYGGGIPASAAFFNPAFSTGGYVQNAPFAAPFQYAPGGSCGGGVVTGGGVPASGTMFYLRR